MPYNAGMSLRDRRRGWESPPDEDWLRDWLEPMLGALESLHRIGRVHGGVNPSNILLLEGDRPMLMGPGGSQHQLGSSLVDLLMASVETPRSSRSISPAALAAGVSSDLCALAEVARFCITGEWPALGDTKTHREPIAGTIERLFAPTLRPHYRSELLTALDAAMSPQVADRPVSVAQLRDWLAHGAPSCRVSVPPPLPPSAAAAARVTSAAGPAAEASQMVEHPTSGQTDPVASSGAPAANVLHIFQPSPTFPATAPTSAAIPTLTAAVEPTPSAAPAFGSEPAGEVDDFPSMWPALSAVLEDLHPKDTVAAKPAGAAPSDGPLRAASTPEQLAPLTAKVQAAGTTIRVPSRSRGQAIALAASAVVVAAAIGLGWAYLRPRTETPSEGVVGVAGSTDDVARTDGPALTHPGDETSPVDTTGPSTSSARVPDRTSAPAPQGPFVPTVPARSRLDARGTGTAGAASTVAPGSPVVARANVDGPRAACAPRTDFALYRCVKDLCASPRWSKSSQCEHLRETDEVE